MIVIAMEQREAMGSRVETGRLGADVAISRNIGPVNDLSETVERRILETVLDDDRFEAAASVDVPQLDSIDVIWNGIFSLGDGHHVIRGLVHELRVGIDKLLDQPRASYPVDVGILSCDPLHRVSSSALC